MIYAGEFAALTTAFLWSFTSIFFTSAGRRVGSYHLNKIRIPMAVLFLGAMLLILEGNLIPAGMTNSSWIYLTLSGIIGLTLGDLCLFTAFIKIGPRLTLLIFASSPIIASIVAWFLLDEVLSIYSILGIIITIGGISWVISERQKNGGNEIDSKTLILGIFLALGASAGQATGLVLAKAGMTDIVDPLNATFIRMVAATAGAWLIGMIRRDNISTIKKLIDKKAVLLMIGGSICGPFLGVWMSLVAVKNTSAGVAAAIMATVPVIVIPLVILIYKEKVSLRAAFGAIITVGGVVLLFLT